MRAFSIRILVLCSCMLSAPGAPAALVEIPLRVPFEPIREALAAQLAVSPGRANVVYREGPCRYLRLEAPTLDAADGRLRLVGPGSAALGVEMFGGCQNAALWRGSMHFTLAPRIDSAGRLRVRIVDSKLTDAGGSTPALGLIWDLSKRQLHPRLEQFSFDLGPLRDALRGLMRSVAPPESRSTMDAALASLQLREPHVQETHVALPMTIEIPDAWLSAPPAASSAPLNEAELEALDEALQPWDAFLAYSIKQLALDSEDQSLRARLFTLLLESRYRLSGILAGEETTAGDPARALFIDVWNELRAILGGSLRYAAFVDAGDALLALDSAAPGLGMRVSADGLRQLARSLRPAESGDPLAFAWTVDAQLQQIFDVPEPAAPARRSWLEHIMRRAHAAGQATPLDRWVPRRHELDAYEKRIGELLQKAAAAEMQRIALPAPYDSVYRHLVPTTALIESCWRQYVVRGGQVTYLRSRSASVGIMQINQRVWRGFYDVRRLRWDTAYNIRAGVQILMRYVKDYAIPYAQRSGDAHDVPRAAYAVYNAGPRAVGRFDKAVPHPREKRVDDRLWTLYQRIASGGQVDLRTCDIEDVALSPSPALAGARAASP